MVASSFEVTVHPGIAHVERVRGAGSHERGGALLVEVPHGADERAHYDALRARLFGEFPEDLHEFFHSNTDVGAWQYGRRVAELLVERRPSLSVTLIRSLIPRTFIDCNRVEDAIAAGAITAAIPPYVRSAEDVALLRSLHRAYVAIAEAAYRETCEAGGFALSPHTYGRYELPIEAIDDRIVERLRACHAPDVLATLSVRPEIDLLTRRIDGSRWAPAALVDDLLATLGASGFASSEGEVYQLAPSTQGARWAERYPTQVLVLEVRRDLLVERYEPLGPMRVDDALVTRVASPLADAIDRAMDRLVPA